MLGKRGVTKTIYMKSYQNIIYQRLSFEVWGLKD